MREAARELRCALFADRNEMRPHRNIEMRKYRAVAVGLPARGG
jgi:hypothetical protein